MTKAARATLAALGLCAALTGPAAAFDIGSMSDGERDVFRSEIRAYLLDNPEVLMEAIGVLEQKQAQAQASADDDLVAAHAAALFDDGFSWVGGNPDGDVVMVEFLDYRCGYCRKAHEEVEKLVSSDGDIKLIVKEFPILGDDSVMSSRFAIATRMVAGAEAYKQVHDALITLRGGVTEATLRRVGKDAGVDVDAVMARMEDPEIQQELLANRTLAEALRVNGTPTFVVGNEILRGYLPLDAMQGVVEQVRGES